MIKFAVITEPEFVKVEVQVKHDAPGAMVSLLQLNLSYDELTELSKAITRAIGCEALAEDIVDNLLLYLGGELGDYADDIKQSVVRVLKLGF